jgi:hypothetical protein
VQFEITHDFDIPRDAVELAVLSPTLAGRLAPRLANIERVDQREHSLKDRVLERVWSWQANVKIPGFAERYVTRDMCAWEERSSYSLDRHASDWTIEPCVKPEWRKYFEAKGTYELVAIAEGRTRRVVRGAIELKLGSRSLFKRLGERMIVSEVKKTFDAEAATLCDLATLE